jgi:hypothetical protein
MKRRGLTFKGSHSRHMVRLGVRRFTCDPEKISDHP